MVQNLVNLVNNLPADLLKDRETFNQIINRDVLDKIPQSKLKLILDKHLPVSLNEDEKLNTINDLFDNKLHFLNINQMDNFYKQAKIHKFTPDLVKHLNELKLLKKKAYHLEEKKFQCKLLNEIIVKKRLLIQKVLNSAPPCKNDQKSFIHPTNHSFNSTNLELIHKIDERYNKELEEIDLGNNLKLDDDSTKLNKTNKINDQDQSINYSIDNEEYLKLLKNFKRKKLRNEVDQEQFKGLSIKKVLDRVIEYSPDFEENLTNLINDQQQQLPKNTTNKRKKKVLIKKNPIAIKHKKTTQLIDEFDCNQKDVELNNQRKSQIKQEQLNSKLIDQQTVKPKTVQIKGQQKSRPETSRNTSTKENEHINKLTTESNYEQAPASFFSLIRNVFRKDNCSNESPSEYKLTLHKLEELVKERLRKYDPKLGWQSELVQSAMNYLSSALPQPKQIPLVDYKEKNQQWQWIANEDCDNDEILIKLTEDWMKELNKYSNNKYSLLDPSKPIPLSLSSTNWIVRESTESEKEEYRRQELLRYQNPNKAFTFDLHDYQSVVGPVKGCTFIKEISNNATSTNTPKFKEKTALLKKRPQFVTLLSLVRDSAARLPNGQGTRQDIVCLLKDSQYLREDLSDEQISGIVSGALDRLHYEKDPAVRYDCNNKVWLYCHRYRSEDDFNRLHRLQIEANLAKKNLQKVPKKTVSSNKITIQPASNKNNTQITIIPKTVELNKNEIDPCKTRDKTVTTDSNQVKTANLNKSKLIDLNQENSKMNPELKNINVKKHQSGKTTTINKIMIENETIKKEPNNKKKNTVKKQQQVNTKCKIEETTYATTLSNLKSDLINKSIKQATKKLKTEQSTTDQEMNNLINNELSTDQIKQQQFNQQTSLPKINNFAVPKITGKDDTNKIVIQNGTNRINLSTNNVILNSTNGPLILSSSNNNLNGFTSFTMTKNGNQIVIYPQKNKLISSNQQASLAIQGMRLVPITNNLQQSTNLTVKPQPIVTKMIPNNKPTQINISTSSSNQSTKSIISCSPKFTISTKSTNV